MIDNHFPNFSNYASCADYPADWWFPQEGKGNDHRWSRTPDAMKARTICGTWPAFDECRAYALAYSGLAGIWAGQDWQERRDLQKRLGITPIFMTDTYDSNVFSMLTEGVALVDE